MSFISDISNLDIESEVEWAVELTFSPVLSGSVTSFTLPAKTRRSYRLELPTSAFTPLDSNLANIMVEGDKIPSPSEPVQKAPTAKTEIITIPNPTISPQSKLNDLEPPKRTLKAPSERRKSPHTLTKNSFSSSSSLRTSYGFATISSPTTKSSTHIPSLQRGREAMHDIPLNPSPAPAPRTIQPTLRTRYSQYFSPVAAPPRPFSIFSFRPSSATLKTREIQPTGTRTVTWTSDERRSIELVNERVPPKRALSVQGDMEKRQARSCWGNVMNGARRWKKFILEEEEEGVTMCYGY